MFDWRKEQQRRNQESKARIGEWIPYASAALDVAGAGYAGTALEAGNWLYQNLGGIEQVKPRHHHGSKTARFHH